MADTPVVRQMAFYWREKKAITANKVAIEYTFNRDPLYGQDGILCYSKGHVILKITASGFTPVGGSFTTDDIPKILAREDIPIAWVVGGKYYRVTAAVTQLKYDSDSEKGSTVEEIQMSCPEPTVAG